MAIKLPPAPLPLRGAKWRCPEPVQVNRSAWTGRSKKVGLPGAAYWTLDATFRTFVGENTIKPWRGWFMSLRGSRHAFPVRATETRQTEAANPTIRAGTLTPSTLPLEGLPANRTVLVAGDMMTVPLPSGHQRLVCLEAPLVSNGQGQGTATFAPELGEVPVAGATVEIREPFALLSLSSDPPGWDVDVGQTYSFAFRAEEAR